MAALGPAFVTPTPTTPLPAPHWVAHSAGMARELGLADDWWADPALLAACAGNATWPGAPAPTSTVYSGHQFGQWAGQLGDGRAHRLGEFTALDGRVWEMQLKGSGATPYSRRGDGRAVLRSSIRELLASEAMHALGVPTTRALALVGSPEPVARETLETAAVVTRLAPSFIRFGHFEHFAAADRVDHLQTLADFVIDRFYPACRDASVPAAALLAAVVERTADLMAHWQAQGFCHGVMNTDNMSILGLTLDYGPYQFLDAYDPGHICNHSDHLGRYAFDRQPSIAYWNLFCLGQALMALIQEPEIAMAALEPFKARFVEQYRLRMGQKLGLAQATADDQPHIDALIGLLAAGHVDHPAFWRCLTDDVAAGHGYPTTARDLFLNREGFDAWWTTFRSHLAQTQRHMDAAVMQRHNPRVVLRNHLAEIAIRAAQAGDFAPTQRLLNALESPFVTHAGDDDLLALPPDWAAHLEISCSS